MAMDSLYNTSPPKEHGVYEYCTTKKLSFQVSHKISHKLASISSLGFQNVRLCIENAYSWKWPPWRLHQHADEGSWENKEQKMLKKYTKSHLSGWHLPSGFAGCTFCWAVFLLCRINF